MACSTRLFPIIAEPHNHHRLLMDLNMRGPITWKWWVTSALRMPSSPAAQGIASCSMPVNSPSSWSRGTTSPNTRQKPQSPLVAPSLTSLPTARNTPRSLLTKMRGPASKAARPWGHPHLGSPTPQAPASPCISLSFQPLPKSEGISMTRRSIHLRHKNGKTNMTTKTTTSPPSPKSHPTVRKTTSRVLTRMAAAPPVR